MLVWLCIVTLFSDWDGASHTSFIIDNLKSEADCQRIAQTVHKINDSPKGWNPRVICVQIEKVKIQ